MQRAKVTHHCWDHPLPIPEGESKKMIGTIIGKSSGIKAVKMPNGDVFEGLRGEFEATNASTGEITSSGICYLPSGFHDLVTGQVQKLNDGEQIEFAYRVYSVPATNAAKFSYAFEPLMPPAETDNLSNLRALLEKPAEEARRIGGRNRRHSETEGQPEAA